MKKNLVLIITEECTTCKRTEHELQLYAQKRNDIKLEILFFGGSEVKKFSSVPALFVENTLFSYGEIDFEKLNKKLRD